MRIMNSLIISLRQQRGRQKCLKVYKLQLSLLYQLKFTSLQYKQQAQVQAAISGVRRLLVHAKPFNADTGKRRVAQRPARIVTSTQHPVPCNIQASTCQGIDETNTQHGGGNNDHEALTSSSATKFTTHVFSYAQAAGPDADWQQPA